MRRITHRVGIAGRSLLFGTVVLCAAQVSAQQSSLLHKKFETMQRGQPLYLTEKPVIRFDGGDASVKLKGKYYADIPAVQQQAVLALARSSRNLVIRYATNPASPIFISASSIGQKRYDLRDEAESGRAALSVMADIAAVFGGNSHEFSVQNVQRDALGKTHARLQQTFRGVRILGAESVVHFAGDGAPEAWNGRVVSLVQNIPAQPALSPPDAAAKCYRDAAARLPDGTPAFASPDEPAALGYSDVAPELVVYAGVSEEIPPVLAYRITVRPNALARREYIVNATTGEILKSYNTTCTAGPATGNGKDLNGQNRQFPVFEVNGTFFMIDASRPMFNAAASTIPGNPVGAIVTLDSKSTQLKNVVHITSSNNSFADAATVSAHFNAGLTYEYFRTTHNRNSLDGKGGTILSAVHVAEANGSAMDNAFWNGKVMAYGDGKQFGNWAKALDVTGHEMTHGVTEHSANLVYLSQSGAINESMSDVFGCMVDRDDFQLFEDITPASFPTGFTRDMANPHNGGTRLGDRGWQPANMSEFQTLPETDDGDNGGVHINSGIPNHAAFLIAQSIGREQTEQIYYRALTQYLTSTSKFIDLRLAVVRAANELFGATAETAAKSAFDKVEIFDGSGTQGPPNDNPVDGPQWLLVHNTNTFTPFTLAVVKPENPTQNDVHFISRTVCNSKPSVSDDGTFAVFVTADKTLHTISLDFTNPEETILSALPVWNSVALSRDGKRVAATPDAQDGTLTVFDLERDSFQAFILYSPTTSQGQRAGLVVGANSLDWDASGQFVLYDALNQFLTDGGSIVEYVDIGLLRAFNKQAGAFSDGLIQRVLPPLGDGENVGNPTFSKTYTGVIAFDYVNTRTKKSAVFGANIFKLDIAEIADNPNAVGMPSYSPDDKRLAFAATEMLSGTPVSVVRTIPLATDRIRATGAATRTIAAATFPVYFGVGKRPSDVEEQTAAPVNMEISPNPASDAVSVRFATAAAGGYSVVVSDAFGREVMIAAREAASPGQQTLELSAAGLPVGAYSVRVSVGNAVLIGRFVVAR